MAKTKVQLPSVNLISADLRNNKIFPVYFLYGADVYSMEAAVLQIENKISPFISSDFDKEIFYGEKNSLAEILDFASAFPFGTGKKFIIVKEFEKIRDKKNLKFGRIVKLKFLPAKLRQPFFRRTRLS